MNDIHDDFIIRYTDVFSEEELKEIRKQIDYFEEQKFLIYEGNETHLLDHHTINLTYNYDLPNTTHISSLILSKFSPCVKHYLKKYSVLGKNRFLVHDCKLKKILSGGGFHNWHFEGSSLEQSKRLFAIQFYLNDDFEGG